MNDYIEQRARIASWMCALGFAVLALAATRAAPADDASCVPVFDAISRLVKTPNHQYLTQSSDAPGSTPQAGEMIFTGKTTYFLHDGKWQASTVTPEETLKRDEENRKNSKTSCHAVRDESVEGVSATVYTLHSESKFGQSEGQIWISKASALPLRQTIDLAVDGATGKSHVETRFVYSGVQAPAGIK
jgi:outer membrane lipoprotein-sorting protein